MFGRRRNDPRFVRRFRRELQRIGRPGDGRQQHKPRGGAARMLGETRREWPRHVRFHVAAEPWLRSLRAVTTAPRRAGRLAPRRRGPVGAPPGAESAAANRSAASANHVDVAASWMRLVWLIAFARLTGDDEDRRGKAVQMSECRFLETFTPRAPCSRFASNAATDVNCRASTSLRTAASRASAWRMNRISHQGLPTRARPARWRCGRGPER